ncbi:MAG: hypothetical protein IPH75_04395 [bacterium]|nr:hypothetical protein [bacterium]
MDVTIIPFDDKYTAETLQLMKEWSSDHPELSRKEIYDWQRSTRWLAMKDGKVVGHIAQVSHDFKYADGRPTVQLGWGITLVINMGDDQTRKNAGRLLLKTCEERPEHKYAAVGVVPIIEPAYIRRGHRITRDSSSYFARFFKPEKALAYWKKSPLLATPLKLANLFFSAETDINHGTIEKITRFLPEWDPLWDTIMKEQYELYGIRNADFLNYKLAQPFREYHAFVHRDTSGVIDGYIIYRRAKHTTRDLDIVRVVDCVATRTAKLDLLAEAMRFAIQDCPGVYGIVGLSSNTDADTFKSAGMWLGRPYPVVLAAGVDGQIHVSLFDSDLDNLW